MALYVFDSYQQLLDHDTLHLLDINGCYTETHLTCCGRTKKGARCGHRTGQQKYPKILTMLRNIQDENASSPLDSNRVKDLLWNLSGLTLSCSAGHAAQAEASVKLWFKNVLDSRARGSRQPAQRSPSYRSIDTSDLPAVSPRRSLVHQPRVQSPAIIPTSQDTSNDHRLSPRGGRLATSSVAAVATSEIASPADTPRISETAASSGMAAHSASGTQPPTAASSTATAAPASHPQLPPPTMASALIRRQLREILQCRICFETLDQPAAYTPCNHYFCRTCIDSWVNSANNIPRNQNPENHFRCPMCRTAGQGERRVDRHLQRIIQMLGPLISD